MSGMNWKYIPPASEEDSSELIRQMGGAPPFPASLAGILVQRGIRTAAEAAHFFAPRREDFHDPALMRDMDKAVARLLLARERNEHILLYGDYDVDGTSAVALMSLALDRLGFHTSYYIPDRYTEGYGISYVGVDHAASLGASLMISLDCGIKDVEKVRHARLRQLDVIICDHHTPGEELPAALAVLDPRREDCGYPYKELTGCGVALKLLQALVRELPGTDLDPLADFADLVTLSIACDLVPITGENRTIAHMGLEKIRSRPLPGIKALMDQSAEARDWDISDLVFFIGPRINAAGRLEHGRQAVEVLLGRSESLSTLAAALAESNDSRKDLDRRLTQEALAKIEADPGFPARSSTVLFDPQWHKGIIGIVASRLIEHHYRPTVLLTLSEGKVVGSARSVPGFDLYAALEACSEHLLQFGGHKYAAGLTLRPEQLEGFRGRFEAVTAASVLPEQKQATLILDARLKFSEIDERLIRILGNMEPFGPENRRPVFEASGVEVLRHQIMKEDHIRFSLRQGGIVLDAVGFNLAAQWREREGNRLDIAFQPYLNTWNDQTRITLRLKDFKIA
ncbi:MAG: single-stranded-DNA-specific exonuclease RecJ [Bacteroidetes bacterium]|nr:MAG: single-stranded-DNA-specific exonuclease RecJ [Bacteroidota bacterium]